MNTLVVYDTTYGNTQQIAQTISTAISAQMVPIAEVDPAGLGRCDLLIVGSPTHGGFPTEGIYHLLTIPLDLGGVTVAAFDTRTRTTVFGYAAPKIARKLVKAGARLQVPPEGFLVLGMEGPLKAGELERAADWAKALADSMNPASQPSVRTSHLEQPVRRSIWQPGTLIRTILLSCGILAALLYVTTTILGAMRYEGYSSTAQSVSELFAIDAPSKALVDPLFLSYSVLWLAFGVGVWVSAGRKLALRIAAVGLIGKEAEGMIVQVFFPMHQRGVATTANDPIHGILTYVGVLSFLIAMGFGAMAFGKRFRFYSIVTLVVCLVFAVLTGLNIPRMAANQPTPWMGVWERITIFGYLLWGVILAIGLCKPTYNDPRRATVRNEKLDRLALNK